jgi:hypothetical protein
MIRFPNNLENVMMNSPNDETSIARPATRCGPLYIPEHMQKPVGIGTSITIGYMFAAVFTRWDQSVFYQWN